jgi:hypothetical protein
MYRGKRKPLDPETIAEDRAILRALEQLADYNPTDPALSIESLQAAEAAMLAAQEAAERARQALERAHAAQQAAMQSLLRGLRRSGASVVVQCGDGGHTVQAIAWMRPSSLHPPARMVLAA